MAQTIQESALNIWPVLVEAAHQRTTIGYGEVSERIGLGTAHLSRQLDVIFDWCKARRFPPLTMLVVDAVTNLPKCEPWADVSVTAADYVREQKRVFEFPWAEHTVEFVRHALSLEGGE